MNILARTDRRRDIVATLVVTATVLVIPASVSWLHAQPPLTSTSLDANSFRAIRLPVGTHPTMLSLTDVNHDGNLDILVANGGSGNVSVYLGNGKGGFSPSDGSPFPAGPNPADIAVGDFNGDGNLDIAIANHSVKLLTVLLGNGKGQFSMAPGSPIAVESDPHPHGIAVADFNGDGKLDIATDSWAENKVLIILGNGDGTFRTPGRKIDVGKMPYQRLRTADVNEDGSPDLITSDFEGGSVTLLLNDGRGNFTRKDVATPPDPFGIAIADVNGDHHPDIVIVHYSGHAVDPSMNGLSVLLGEGKGNFALAKGSPFPTGQYPGTVSAGDLTGDGIADIVVPNYQDGTLTVYMWQDDQLVQARFSPLRIGRTPHGVAIGDLNHDGRGDLVIAQEEENDITVLLRK